MNGRLRVVYSRARMVRLLLKRDGGTRDEVQEHIDFNVVNAVPGKNAPILVDDELP